MKITKALSFDDVLIVPKKFNGKSRDDVDLSTNIAGLELTLPILSANMASITEVETAIHLGCFGGLGILHRMCSIEKQVSMVKDVKADRGKILVGASIGIGNNCIDDAQKLIDAKTDIICIDVAHAHQLTAIEVVKKFKDKFNNFPLIIGNIATAEGAQELFEIKPQNTVIKAGIGGGSLCTTRVHTGAGLPTLQSILDISKLGIPVIGDGGIKTSGDICKALCAGSIAVMCGSIFAGCTETPGEIIKDSATGHKYKVYRGSASYGAKKEFFNKAEFIEGAETLIPFKGYIREQIIKLEQGIRSGFSYGGALNIKELQEKAEFVEITSASFREGLPHGLLK